MIKDQDEIITQAVERNSAAVLALPSAGMFRYHKTRFLRGIDERIWLESVPEDRLLINSLIESGLPAVVSFRFGHVKATFASPILQLDEEYRFFDAQDAIQALVVTRPQTVKSMQRRSNYRVSLRPQDGFRVRLWRIADQADIQDKPNDIFELAATPRDLSVGGVGVIFQTKPLLITNQRLRVLLAWSNHEPVVLEGRCGQVRHETANNIYKTGIQFQNLQQSLEGRRFVTELTRIISALQLEEAKRSRRNAG